jgi:hypothetical protein
VLTNSQDPQGASTLTYSEQSYTSKDSSDWKHFSGPQNMSPESYFMESPLSTGGPFYTPLDNGYLNPFEGSFLSAQSNVSFNDYSETTHPCSAIGYQNDCGNESSAPFMVTPPCPPCVSLSNIAIDDFLNDENDTENITRESRAQSPKPSLSTRQPVWTSPHRSSTLSGSKSSHEHHKRTKSEIHSRNLRSNSVSSFLGSFNPSGARTNHNLVEKKYRTRLNGQFQTLLKSLPSEGAEKRVRKAEVLILAKDRIRELEVGKKILETERVQLQMSFEKLKERWVDLGGICMP